MCTRYHEEIKVVDAVPEAQAIGILYILLGSLKETSLPEPTRLLAIVENVLPWYVITCF